MNYCYGNILYQTRTLKLSNNNETKFPNITNAVQLSGDTLWQWLLTSCDIILCQDDGDNVVVDEDDENDDEDDADDDDLSGFSLEQQRDGFVAEKLAGAVDFGQL